MSSHTIYCSSSVEYKNDRANERINSEIFPLNALNFQFVMKEKVNVYVVNRIICTCGLNINSEKSFSKK